MGIYVSPERIERGGVLVAFKGEIMTEEEAASRGILPSQPAAKKARGNEEPEQDTEEKATEVLDEEPEQDTEDAGFEELSNAELKDYIAQRGGEFKTRATHAELVAIAEGLE